MSKTSAQASVSGIGFTLAAIAGIALAAGSHQAPVKASERQTELTASVRTTRVQSPGGEYTVRSGDTLAGIAGREYGNYGCWPGIYAANSGSIRDPNMIYVGQTLAIPSGCSTRGVVQTDANTQPAPAPAPRESSGGGYSVDSSFQACVIRAESGGNPYIWNASGHWGLYQFSEQTWIGYGGAASLFGSAGPAYQTQIFDNAMATPGGAENWSPYDHCTP